MVRKITVQQVKEIAMKKYEKGGDVIIECWTTEDIENYIKEGNGRKRLRRLMSAYHAERTVIESTRF